jgi:hypothetical protein
VKGETAISSSSDETTRLEDDTRCRRTGVQAPFEATGSLALPPRRDSPHGPCEGVPPTSESCRASLAGLATREPSAAAHAGLASRSAELVIDPPSPPERIDDRDPCRAELLLRLGGRANPVGASFGGGQSRRNGSPPPRCRSSPIVADPRGETNLSHTVARNPSAPGRAPCLEGGGPHGRTAPATAATPTRPERGPTPTFDLTRFSAPFRGIGNFRRRWATDADRTRTDTPRRVRFPPEAILGRTFRSVRWSWTGLKGHVRRRDQVCVSCGGTDQLQVHHRTPISDKGQSQIRSTP